METAFARQIYQKYQLPGNLQNHLLWTAALGLLVSSHWTGPRLDSQLITTNLLLHDIANLIKFNFQGPLSQKSITKEKDLDYWKTTQKNLKQNYGSDVLSASIHIIQELNPEKSDRIIDLLKKHTFEAMPSLLKSQNSWEHKIILYCDIRFKPEGISSISERILDLKKRYQNRDDEWINKQTFRRRLDNSLEIEQQLNSHTDIDLPAVTQKQLEKYISQAEQYPLRVNL